MSKKATAQRRPKETSAKEMQVRFAPLPDGCQDLVAKYGQPEVFLYEGISVLIFSCGFDSKLDSRGLVLCRVDDDDSFAKGAVEVERLVKALAGKGKRPSSIIVSSCAVDRNPWTRRDLSWAYEIIIGDRLEWVAISDQDAVSSEIEIDAVFGYGDEVEEYRWLDEVDGEVLTLSDLT